MNCNLYLPPVALLFLVCVGQTSHTNEGHSDFLATYCYECHGSSTQEADLRLDSLPQDEESLQDLWQRISEKLRQKEMPPDEAKQPTQEETQVVLDWIREKHGQLEENLPPHWSFLPVKRPLVPQISKTRDLGGYPANEIDAFILAKLDEAGLPMSPVAPRHQLIRRVTLDLTGLPPTPEEVAAFVESSEPTDVAFQRVVARLLRSPRYGERWAQHWLDVIRWAETVGFETNFERADAWPYRDWVIRAFNEDMPYDQFIRSQLLGDRDGDDAALGFLVAGPANLPGQIGRDEEAMRQARLDELDEVIRTVSQSMFGLTIGCARCHDHKFDPLLQSDYYSMQAIFAGLQYGHRRLRGELNDQWTAQIPDAQDELRRLETELEELRVKFKLRPPLSTVQQERFEPLMVDSVRMEIDATESGAASLYEFEIWTTESTTEESRNVALAKAGAKPSASSFALENQTRHFENLVDGDLDRRQAFPWVAASAGPAWIQVDLANAQEIDRVVWHRGSTTPAEYRIRVREPGSDSWKTVADTYDRRPRISDLRPPKKVHLRGMTDEQVAKLVQKIAEVRKAQKELSRISAGPQVYAASFNDQAPPTWLLTRGDPMRRDTEVPPAIPAFLFARLDGANEFQGESLDSQAEYLRRLALVEHLTRADHPLTSRVIVNRIWQHHFGIGLVETPSDFGKMGAQPSHPQLLDWLANRLVTRRWSIKDLHRTIVTSRTYVQSSLPVEGGIRKDAQSRLLWRFPPRRLSAEAIRDSILHASGKLNLEMYGRGFDFFQQRGGLSDYKAKETFDETGWRRMVYAHKIRMESVDIFGAFDCPDAGQMTPKRSQSITPLQALGLFNSPFVIRQAKFFAGRLQAEENQLEDQIGHAFQIALARDPTTQEQSNLRHLAVEHGLEQVCRVLLNSSEFLYIH